MCLLLLLLLFKRTVGRRRVIGQALGGALDFSPMANSFKGFLPTVKGRQGQLQNTVCLGWRVLSVSSSVEKGTMTSLSHHRQAIADGVRWPEASQSTPASAECQKTDSTA